MAITFNRAQNTVAGDGTDATATFGSSPREGNLLVAIAFSRSGESESSHSISGTGWTKRVARDTELLDTYRRRALSVWTKVAGASEPNAIEVTGGTVKLRLVVSEYEAGEAVTWVLEGSADNDNGATDGATSIGTGTTGDVPDDDLLIIGILGARKYGSTNQTVNFDILDNEEIFDGLADNGRIIGTGYQQVSSGGTKTSIATMNTGENTGLSAAILVFSATGSATTTYTRDTSWRIRDLADKDAAWKLLTDRIQDTAWNIRNTDTRDIAWSILKESQRNTAWKLLGQANLDLAWQIFASGVNSQAISWKIRTDISADLSWRILQDKQANTSWRVFTIDYQAVAWDLLARTARDCAWMLLNVNDQEIGWRILGEEIPVPKEIFSLSKGSVFAFNLTDKILLRFHQKQFKLD